MCKYLILLNFRRSHNPKVGGFNSSTCPILFNFSFLYNYIKDSFGETMRNTTALIFSLFFLPAINLLDGAIPDKKGHLDSGLNNNQNLSRDAQIDTSNAYFSGNEWYSMVLNDGQWSSYQPLGGAGGIWPRGSHNSVLFNSGLWIGFRDDDGSSRMAGVEYGSDFRPGPYGNTDSESNDDYRVYKVNRWDDATNTDWAAWPVDLGAPWEDNDGDGTYNPAVDNPYLPLDQTLFTVYSDSGEHDQFGGTPIGAEIRQTIFGGVSSNHDNLARTFYVKYEIINRGTSNWNDPRFAVWSDPDLCCDAKDDLLGVECR